MTWSHLMKMEVLKRGAVRGFTLVELMVVVGIIGILTSVAVPSFKLYLYKSKYVEAKLGLVRIYLAEKQVYSSYSNYASCIYHVLLGGGGISGKIQDLNPGKYYSLGFRTLVAPPEICNPSNGTEKVYSVSAIGDVLSGNTYISNSYLTPSQPPYRLSGIGGVAYKKYANWNIVVKNASNAFVAGATAALNLADVSFGARDVWTIDQDKILTHEQSGK